MMVYANDPTVSAWFATFNVIFAPVQVVFAILGRIFIKAETDSIRQYYFARKYSHAKQAGKNKDRNEIKY